MTLSEIEERQKKWKSVAIQLYVTQDFSNLISNRSGPLYNYDTGYVLGLYLAEGSKAGSHAFCLTAHKLEVDDPEFGAYLRTYFHDYFKVTVKLYNKKNNCVAFQVDCMTFRSLIEEHIKGQSAKTKNLCMEKCLKHGKPFIRGIVDGFVKGDGYYNEKYDLFEVGICDNRNLLENLRTLCLFIGYEFKEQAATKTKAFGGSFKRLNFWLRKTLYAGKRKPRQNGLIVEHLDGISTPRGKAVQGTSVIDIDVDIAHHMFFIANGILTQNSNS